MAQSIIQAFEKTVERRGNAVAAQFRGNDGAWKTQTWVEFDHDRRAIGVGLIELGMEKGERGVILSNSSMKWMVTDLALQSTGGETVPIYQSNLASEAEYIINDSDAVYVFVEDLEQLEKLHQIRNNVPKVRKVIVMNDAGESSDWVMKWSELHSLGESKLSERAAELKQRTDSVDGSDILTIIYTSGTTGKPKGVVLTHDNMLYEAKAAMEIALVSDDDMELLFLPMAHVSRRSCRSFGSIRATAWPSTPTRPESPRTSATSSRTSSPPSRASSRRSTRGSLEWHRDAGHQRTAVQVGRWAE
ncbi:MAG: AMP-binding protein [Myxococcales bacterium]|nr:AMP-binding protein [Myxococcales bacterium]